MRAIFALKAPPSPTFTLANAWPGGFVRVTCDLGVGLEETSEPVRAEMVVNIPVDGLGAGFGSHPPGTPNLQTLLDGGQLPNFAKLIGDDDHSVREYNGQTTFPSITFSAWASWATGLEPHAHGVNGSNFFRRDALIDKFWHETQGLDMYPPVDHVSFHGNWPILDLDIENVWGSIGTFNSAVRPYPAVTIHEAVCNKGMTSAVVYHMVWRGARWLEDPGALWGWWVHGDPVASDRSTADEVNNLFATTASQTKIFPPNLLTVYFSGLDVDCHKNVNYPASGANHLKVTDRFLGVLIRHLELWNLLDGAMFTFTGDHGLTRVADDDTHSLMLETPLDRELERVFTGARYVVLDNVALPDYDAVVGLNGGMAHVYVKNRGTGNWRDVPRYVQDVLPIAQRFRDNNLGLVSDEPELLGSLRLILVRDANGSSSWGELYQVFLGGTTTMSLADAASGGLVPANWVDFQQNINSMTGWRSGDVVLLPNFCGVGTGYYFGKQMPGWHGSLCDTDMIIPLVFSYPRGDGQPLAEFLNIVNAAIGFDPSITDITPIVYKVLTGEVSHDAVAPNCAFSP